jgi:hypothetical protein
VLNVHKMLTQRERWWLKKIVDISFHILKVTFGTCVQHKVSDRAVYNKATSMIYEISMRSFPFCITIESRGGSFYFFRKILNLDKSLKF